MPLKVSWKTTWGGGRGRAGDLNYFYSRETSHLVTLQLQIREVWSSSSLSAWRKFVFSTIQIALGQDSKQAARMWTDLNLRWVHICRRYVSWLNGSLKNKIGFY